MAVEWGFPTKPQEAKMQNVSQQQPCKSVFLVVGRVSENPSCFNQGKNVQGSHIKNHHTAVNPRINLPTGWVFVGRCHLCQIAIFSVLPNDASDFVPRCSSGRRACQSSSLPWRSPEAPNATHPHVVVPGGYHYSQGRLGYIPFMQWLYSDCISDSTLWGSGLGVAEQFFRWKGKSTEIPLCCEDFRGLLNPWVGT